MTKRELFLCIEDLKLQLVAKYAPDKVILFGSAARDDEPFASKHPPTFIGLTHSVIRMLKWPLVGAMIELCSVPTAYVSPGVHSGAEKSPR